MDGRLVSVEKPSFTGTNVIEGSMYNGQEQLHKRTTMAGSTRLIADVSVGVSLLLAILACGNNQAVQSVNRTEAPADIEANIRKLAEAKKTLSVDPTNKQALLVLAFSSDGGRTWATIHRTRKSARVNALAILDPNKVLAVGDGG